MYSMVIVNHFNENYNYFNPIVMLKLLKKIINKISRKLFNRYLFSPVTVIHFPNSKHKTIEDYLKDIDSQQVKENISVYNQHK